MSSHTARPASLAFSRPRNSYFSARSLDLAGLPVQAEPRQDMFGKSLICLSDVFNRGCIESLF